MLFFEWTNFEIGVIAAGKLGRDQISIMSIGIQTIYIAFMVIDPHKFTKKLT